MKKRQRALAVEEEQGAEDELSLKEELQRADPDALRQELAAPKKGGDG